MMCCSEHAYPNRPGVAYEQRRWKGSANRERELCHSETVRHNSPRPPVSRKDAAQLRYWPWSAPPRGFSTPERNMLGEQHDLHSPHTAAHKSRVRSILGFPRTTGTSPSGWWNTSPAATATVLSWLGGNPGAVSTL
jgi:hypothetical protein